MQGDSRADAEEFEAEELQKVGTDYGADRNLL
jgi:hypothetical protein